MGRETQWTPNRWPFRFRWGSLIIMQLVRPADLAHFAQPGLVHPAVAAAVAAMRTSSPTTRLEEPEVLADFIPPSRALLFLKRSVDVLLVVASLPLVLPLMALIALLVKMTSRGPVLFKHVRVGRHGHLFRVLKFRTMTPGTHESIWSDVDKIEQFAASGFKLADRDPAITAFGRFLRRTSLDELPQLFNVLGGSMSLVGVRPLVVPEVTMRSELDQILYILMKPGITGLWQTNGRSAVDVETRCGLDRRYVLEWSVGRDLAILLKTPVALLRTHHAA